MWNLLKKTADKETRRVSKAQVEECLGKDSLGGTQYKQSIEKELRQRFEVMRQYDSEDGATKTFTYDGVAVGLAGWDSQTKIDKDEFMSMFFLEPYLATGSMS